MTTAVAAAAPATTAVTEDQSDRLLRKLVAGQAEQTKAAVALARFGERNLVPIPAAQPSALTAPAATGASVNVLSTLLLSLIGGLVGGGAAIIGWTATSRRRSHRPAAA